jgi:hypothetical protein
MKTGRLVFVYLPVTSRSGPLSTILAYCHLSNAILHHPPPLFWPIGRWRYTHFIGMYIVPVDGNGCRIRHDLGGVVLFACRENQCCFGAILRLLPRADGRPWSADNDGGEQQQQHMDCVHGDSMCAWWQYVLNCLCSIVIITNIQ